MQDVHVVLTDLLQHTILTAVQSVYILVSIRKAMCWLELLQCSQKESRRLYCEEMFLTKLDGFTSLMV
jgi:hypothetical protein